MKTINKMTEEERRQKFGAKDIEKLKKILKSSKKLHDWYKTEKFRKMIIKNGIKSIKSHSNFYNPKTEQLVEKLLIEMKLEYKKQFVLCNRYIYDFYIPKDKLLIEVNGCFWHRCPKCYSDKDKVYDVQRKSIIRDASKIKLAGDRGYSLLIIWEHELKKLKEIKLKVGSYRETSKNKINN